MWQRWYQSAGKLAGAACGDRRRAGAGGDAGVIGMRVDPGDWRAFWAQVSGWLASTLLSAAVICLVAANWSAISPFARLAGLQAILVAVTLASLHPRLSGRACSLVLLLASMLLGALLALVGQTWQTGADPWQLFALWAVLMTCWAVAACSVVVWLLWLAVANAGLALWAQALPDSAVELALLVFTGFNLLAIALWEAGWQRLDWLRHSAGPRILVAWLLGMLAGCAVWLAIEGPTLALASSAGVALACWAFSSLCIAGCYLRARRDLAVLAIVLLTAIGVLTVRIGLLLDWRGGHAPIQVGLLALLVLAQGAVAASWLRRMAAGGRP